MSRDSLMKIKLYAN